MKGKIISTDLFCGAGGFSSGFEQAGFECIGALDHKEIFVETHKFNFKRNRSVCADNRAVSPDILSTNGCRQKKVDIIIGSTKINSLGFSKKLQ